MNQATPSRARPFLKSTDMKTVNPSDIAAGFVRPNLATAVADHLRRHLTRTGSRGVLPGERIIAATPGVGRPTVRDALDILMREGLILRHRGQSTRVVPRTGPPLS
jgi:DNA-binding FadR family transcriptional regulator